MAVTKGAILLTGSFVGIGTTYTAVTLAGSPGVPRSGFITRVKVKKTSGTGTGARARMYEPVTSRELFEYDDPDNPGAPITFDAADELHVCDPPLWYNRAGGTLQIELAFDASTTGTVEVEVVLP